MFLKFSLVIKTARASISTLLCRKITTDNETIATESRLISLALVSAIYLSGIMICNFNELLSFYAIVNFIFVGAFMGVMKRKGVKKRERKRD